MPKNIKQAAFINPNSINSIDNFAAFSQLTLNTLHTDMAKLTAIFDLPAPLKSACDYALSGNGKRVRPMLVSSTFLTLKKTPNQPIANATPKLSDACRRAMLAVELLHTYSLVHDDLPCMDDDELRRGRATTHVVYGEAVAMLVGDVLQTLAFEVLTAEMAGFNPIDNQLSQQLMTLFAPRARRMVAGQMLDLNAEHMPKNMPISQNELEAIHRDKTGALIEAAVLMGACCGRATNQQMQALTHFASNIGLAFQVQDDILDVTVSTDELGKPAGSDEKLDKSTYVKLMGVNAANDYAKTLFEDAKNRVQHHFGQDNLLLALADWLWQRKK